MKYIIFYESFPFFSFNQSLEIGDYVELIDNDEGRVDGYWKIEDIKLDSFDKTNIYDLVRGEDTLSEEGRNLRKVSEEEYNVRKYNL